MSYRIPLYVYIFVYVRLVQNSFKPDLNDRLNSLDYAIAYA